MVGGIVVMRSGENALNVIQKVKAKLDELKPSLPPGEDALPSAARLRHSPNSSRDRMRGFGSVIEAVAETR